MGAFQYLEHKQKLRDGKKENFSKSCELTEWLKAAKTILCDIEIAINSTNLRMPFVFTRKSMEHELHFGNTDLDIRITKSRFQQYLLELQRVLKRPRKKPPMHLKRQNRGKPYNGKRNVTTEATTSIQVRQINTNDQTSMNEINKDGMPQLNKRKEQRQHKIIDGKLNPKRHRGNNRIRIAATRDGQIQRNHPGNGHRKRQHNLHKKQNRRRITTTISPTIV